MYDKIIRGIVHGWTTQGDNGHDLTPTTTVPQDINYVNTVHIYMTGYVELQTNMITCVYLLWLESIM